MQEPLIFKEAVSEKRLLNVVKEVSNYHRIQASPMFREAAEHVMKICKKYGLNAKLHMRQIRMSGICRAKCSRNGQLRKLHWIWLILKSVWLTIQLKPSR